MLELRPKLSIGFLCLALVAIVAWTTTIAARAGAENAVSSTGGQDGDAQSSSSSDASVFTNAGARGTRARR